VTVENADILIKLVDLHRQATSENSHFYTAGCIKQAVAEIASLRRDMHARDLEWTNLMADLHDEIKRLRDVVLWAGKHGRDFVDGPLFKTREFEEAIEIELVRRRL
jgi:hypothetical protein